jgi:hypothetical protein
MLQLLRRRAMLRGPFGGSKQWTLLWAVLIGLRLVRKMTHREPEVVFSERLAPGESLVIAGREVEPRVIGGATADH